MLDAGRGNPNWTAIAPREAFIVLSQFAMNECRRDMDTKSGLCGIPQKPGIAKRLWVYLQARKDEPGGEQLMRLHKKAARLFKGEPDAWVYEIVDAVVGCHYPNPTRILPHCEMVLNHFLACEIFNHDHDEAPLNLDLFAVEGVSAGVCYIFDSLIENRLLKPGDHIALGIPAFIPYSELPQLAKYNFKVTYIHGSGRNPDGTPNYQYPDKELDKLGNTDIKLFFIVNPSSPTSVRMRHESRSHLTEVVSERNPGLMILTDDVYGTFVDGFCSIMDVLPRNTMLTYSFSKYYGATGWRLGVIALAPDNIYDEMIAALPAQDKRELNRRYRDFGGKNVKFIDRMAIDSRDVVLDKTAGLSTPQQAMMMLMAAYALLDREENDDKYKKACRKLVAKRNQLFWEALELPQPQDANRSNYYTTFDLREWAITTHGQEFFEWLKKNYKPDDLVQRVARESSVVLMDGGGFTGSEWAARISLANLNNRDYVMIGHILRDILKRYVAKYNG